MSQPVKISDALVLDARLTGEVTERSIAGQIEFWARLGRAIEPLLRGDQASIADWRRFVQCKAELLTNREGERQKLHLPQYADDETLMNKQCESMNEPGHERKTGRNDPCPCRGGKKFTKCHGANTSSNPAIQSGPRPEIVRMAFEKQ